VHVKRGRIGGADPNKTSLAAPEFHGALKVRVENPRVYHLTKGSGWSQVSPEAILSKAERIRARRGRRTNVTNGKKIDHTVYCGSMWNLNDL